MEGRQVQPVAALVGIWRAEGRAGSEYVSLSVSGHVLGGGHIAL